MQRHVPLQVVHGQVRALAVLAVDGLHQRVDAAVQLRHVAARGARRVGDLKRAEGRGCFKQEDYVKAKENCRVRAHGGH